MVLVDPIDLLVEPPVGDVARGLLAYEGRGDDRRRWAFGDPLSDEARTTARRLGA